VYFSDDEEAAAAAVDMTPGAQIACLLTAAIIGCYNMMEKSSFKLGDEKIPTFWKSLLARK